MADSVASPLEMFIL